MYASSPTGLRRLHLALDAITIVAAMALSVWLQVRLQRFVPVLKELPDFSQYATLAYLTLPLWLLLIVGFGLHSSLDRPRDSLSLLSDLVKLHLAGFAGLSAGQFLTQSVLNRSVMGLFMLSSFALMYAERLVLHAWVRYQHRRGQGQRQLLIIGQPSGRMMRFVRDAAAEPLPPRIVGYLRPASVDNALSLPPPGDDSSLECLGTLDDVARVLHEQPIDQVLFFPPCNRPELLRDALSACEELGVVASFSVDLVQLSQARPRIESVYEHPFVSFNVAPRRPESLALKHALDVVLAAVLVVLLLPVWLAIGLLIALTMGRPILFVQERAGLNGRPFRMLKFRTMARGAEAARASVEALNEMSGPVFKATDDPRVTPTGRLLRRTSLDELPQLFNVLSGAMSLVGPRPLPLSEQQQIRGWQRRRLSVKPGITCLWQIGGRNDLAFDEWMLLDLQYIDEWSLGLDFTILLKTLPAVLSRRGAR